jgi:regulator of replication initiation timing
MLQWKRIMERWHLTYEESFAICRLVAVLAEQTQGEVCLACLDSLTDARLQWLSLDLSKLLKEQDT